jgi:DUF1365 family protein
VDVRPEIFLGKVMHKRLFPKVNAFTYGIYYLSLPLRLMAGLGDGWRFAIDAPAVMSFHTQDHAARIKKADLQIWAEGILQQHGVDIPDATIVLLAMPRIFGYVFNPVSFWFCYDGAQHLRAVICEVNNTFGETHSYICAHPEGRPITGEDWMQAEKLFHVSPFLVREGSYRFRFDIRDNKTGIWIDYYDAAGRKQLLTALTGQRVPLTPQNCRRAFWSYPLVTLRAIFLIHWQAVKLLAKGIKYIPKPLQKKEKSSSAYNLTKN